MGKLTLKEVFDLPCNNPPVYIPQCCPKSTRQKALRADFPVASSPWLGRNDTPPIWVINVPYQPQIQAKHCLFCGEGLPEFVKLEDAPQIALFDRNSMTCLNCSQPTDECRCASPMAAWRPVSKVPA